MRCGSSATIGYAIEFELLRKGQVPGALADFVWTRVAKLQDGTSTHLWRFTATVSASAPFSRVSGSCNPSSSNSTASSRSVSPSDAVPLSHRQKNTRASASQKQIDPEHMRRVLKSSGLQQIYGGARLVSRVLDINPAEKPVSSEIGSHSAGLDHF